MPARFQPGNHRARCARRQQGYALLVVLLVFSIFVITLATAVPSWKTEIQRDHETEEIDRAHQYVEGIQRYYHKFGSYPPNLQRLKETNGIHYLRQAWPDPLTGKPFKLLQFSDLKNGEVVGGGLGIPGAAGASGSPNGTQITGGNTGGSLGSGTGGGLSMGGGLGGSNPGAGLFSNSDDEENNSSASSGIGPGTAATGTGSALGAAGSPSPTPASGAASGSSGGLFSGSTGLAAGHVFGGSGIVGVASTSKKPAVHAFNRKNRPDRWQFVYSPMKDRSLLGPGVGNGPALGQQIGTQPGTTSSGTQGSGWFGSGTTGTNSGSGSSGTGSNPGAGLFNDSGSN